MKISLLSLKAFTKGMERICSLTQKRAYLIKVSQAKLGANLLLQNTLFLFENQLRMKQYLPRIPSASATTLAQNQQRF